MDPSAATSLRVDRGTGPRDLVLVGAALRGERDAVDQVMQRMSCVVRFVFRLNRSMGYSLPAEALEDVVQQVYLSAWPRLPDYAGTSALETWLFGFCRNCLRAEFRRRTRRLASQGDEEFDDQRSGSPEPEEHALRTEGLDLLQEALAELDDLDRELVERRHLDGCSFEQIARQTNLPASTIKDRCYRALDRIRTRLKRRYGRA